MNTEETINLIDLGEYQIRQLDSLNVVLERKTPKATVIVSYHNDAMGALRAYAKSRMATKKWQSIDDVERAYKELQEEIKRVGEKLNERNIR